MFYETNWLQIYMQPFSFASAFFDFFNVIEFWIEKVDFTIKKFFQDILK
jgi:hypothetical protein